MSLEELKVMRKILHHIYNNYPALFSYILDVACLI